MIRYVPRVGKDSDMMKEAYVFSAGDWGCGRDAHTPSVHTPKMVEI